MTWVDPLAAFYPAETCHRDYLTRHPDEPYIAIYDLPKVDALKRLFPEDFKAQPALVLSNATDLVHDHDAVPGGLAGAFSVAAVAPH